MLESENGSKSSRHRALIRLVSDFYNEILLSAPWFVKLNSPQPLWDVLFIGGSSKYNMARPGSDIDIFLVMPRRVQLERQIKPVYEFEFCNHVFEVSQLSTELMYASQNDKRYLFHWHESILVKASSAEAEAAFHGACELTPNQLRQIVWTAFAEFMICSESYASSPQFYDELAAQISRHDTIKSFTYVFLLTKNRCHTIKWLSLNLLDFSPDVHATLSQLSQEVGLSLEFFVQMGYIWENFLPAAGLVATNEVPWYEQNLDLLLFQ